MMLMSYGFDSDNCNFNFKRCLFEYKSREFILYPGNMRLCDSFDTLVADNEDADKAFELLHEFLYLFGWANNCAFHFVGGSGMSANRDLMMRRSGPVYRCPRGFWNSGMQLISMKDPSCSQDFMKVISLYNDAQYSNDIFYRFFCLFKILDLPVNGQKRNPAKWINNNQHCFSRSQITDKVFQLGQNLGIFLQDECRNAIAHIHRDDPSKSSVISYSSKDYEKISIACSMIMPFVRLFIEKEIGEPPNVAVNVVFQDDLPQARAREIDKLGEFIFEFQSFRVDKVTTLQQDGGILSELIWKIDGYIHATLAKVLNLGTVIGKLWTEEEAVASIFLARSIMETVADLYAFHNGLKKLVEVGSNLAEVHDYCTKCLFASGDIQGLPEARNIKTQLDKIEKDIPHFEETYAQLSEVCQPNYFGVLGGYSKLDKENMTVIMGMNKSTAFKVMDECLPIALGFMRLIKEMADEYFQKLRPVLISLLQEK